MRRNVTILFAALVLVAFATAYYFAAYRSSNRLILANGTDQSLPDVYVTAGTSTIWHGALPPHNLIEVSVSPDSASEFEVKFSWRGKQIGKKAGYLSPGLNLVHVIAIGEDGELTYAAAQQSSIF